MALLTLVRLVMLRQEMTALQALAPMERALVRLPPGLPGPVLRVLEELLSLAWCFVLPRLSGRINR